MLHLSNNELDPTGAESFGAGLKMNMTTVIKFVLSSNKVVSADTGSLAAVLKTITALRFKTNTTLR